MRAAMTVVLLVLASGCGFGPEVPQAEFVEPANPDERPFGSGPSWDSLLLPPGAEAAYGWVKVQVLINPDGRVTRTAIYDSFVRATDNAEPIQRAAMQRAPRLSYRAAEVNGHKVPSQWVVEFRFGSRRDWERLQQLDERR